MQSCKKIKTGSIILVSILAAHCAQAQAFDQAQTRADTDLREAVETLSQVRQQIEEGKAAFIHKNCHLRGRGH